MVNKVILIGNLGKDPELRTTSGGQSVASVTLATNEKFKDRDGNLQERTEWHNIVLWGRDAENVHKYCKKGKQLYVEGRLQTRKWQDKEGKDRYTTEIVAEMVKFLGGGQGGGGGEEGGGRGGYSGGGGGGGYSGGGGGGGYSGNRGGSGGGGGGGGNRPNAPSGPSRGGDAPQGEETPPYHGDDDIPF